MDLPDSPSNDYSTDKLEPVRTAGLTAPPLPLAG